MNQTDLINPFSLLGIKETSSLSELKKNYYNMALLCHPDKGGSQEDMHIVNSAYKYIKNQLENAKDKETTYEGLEEEFQNFCMEQTREPQPFSQIYEETNDWIKDFNKKFDENIKQTQQTEESLMSSYENSSFGLNNGYGEIMDDSLYVNRNTTNLEYNDKEEEINTIELKKEIIEYKEPNPIPDTITLYPLDNKKIDDFSSLSGSLKMGDYLRTFSECDLPSNVKHHKQFADYPKNNK